MADPRLYCVAFGVVVPPRWFRRRPALARLGGHLGVELLAHDLLDALEQGYLPNGEEPVQGQRWYRPSFSNASFFLRRLTHPYGYDLRENRPLPSILSRGPWLSIGGQPIVGGGLVSAGPVSTPSDGIFSAGSRIKVAADTAGRPSAGGWVLPGPLTVLPH